MLDDNAVHRRTVMVVLRHGRDAPDFAAMVARELAKAGDEEGCKVWWSVSRAARELLSCLGTPLDADAAPLRPDPV